MSAWPGQGGIGTNLEDLAETQGGLKRAIASSRMRERLVDLRRTAQEVLRQISLGHTFTGNPHEDAQLLCTLVGNPFDLIKRPLHHGEAVLLYFASLVDEAKVLSHAVPLANEAEWRKLSCLPGEKSVGQTLDHLLRGDAVLLVGGDATYVWLFAFPRSLLPKAPKPNAERVVRGPRLAISEDLMESLGMVRTRLPHPGLRVTLLTLGRYTKTHTALIRLQGVADSVLESELLSRLRRIDVDEIVDTAEISHYIADGPWSPFPTIQPTERLDTVLFGVVDGRFALLSDGTETGLLVPTRYADLMVSPEDYYLSPYMASFARLMRYVGSVAAITLPSFYIGLVTIHPELIPTPLVLAIARSRTGVPFPTFLEVLLMELTIELIREAGLRLPSSLSTAVTIVGALVLGQAVVAAGIISAPVVIVVAVTALASFVMPQYETAFTIRLLRFPVMVLAAVTGLLGIFWYLAMLLAHMCQLRSLGVPYLAPFGPVRTRAISDSFVSVPLWRSLLRPLFAQANRVRRSRSTRPLEPVH